MALVLLDSEALSTLAAPKERGVSRRRAQAVLTAGDRDDALIRTSVCVLAEAYRGSPRDAAIDRIINKGIDVIPVDRGIARIAGHLLSHAGLDSCSAIDALLVATAIRLDGALILTSDYSDLIKLAAGHPEVEVQRLP